MLLLKTKGFEVENGGAVVTADEAGAVARAEEIVAAAEAEAKRVAEEAKAAAEAAKKKGYEDGLAEGRQEILMQKLDLLDESVRYMEGVELKMADIVMKALRKCVAEIGDKELVVQIVKKSMQAVVRNQRQITVKVAPEMVATVRERLNEILKDFPSVATASVVEDPHLAGAACVVETEAGLVEASVGGQLAAIEKSIRKNLNREG